MKVCMIAYTFYETDGRVRRYAEALAKRGDEVDAIVLRQEGQTGVEIINGVKVHRIQKRVRDERGPFSYLAKLLLFFFHSSWVVTKRHLAGRYDLIHVHSVPDFQVFSTLIPRLMGAQVILDIHDIIPEFYASKFAVSENSFVFRILLLIEKLSAGYSNHVIIANHLWYAKLIRRSVPADKCTALINYPDPSVFFCRPRTESHNGDFLMCYPGTLNWHQGLDVAINAMTLVRLKAPHAKFLIIGDGPDREKLKVLVQTEGLEDHVIMSGIMPIEQVAKIMANVDVGVVPKRKNSFGNEAFSTKIMEFMASGVPVIASDTKIDQYYFHDTLVQFFESGNSADLADKIIDLAQDSEKKKTLTNRSLAFIQDNNWGVKKHEYLDLVDRLVKRIPIGA